MFYNIDEETLSRMNVNRKHKSGVIDFFGALDGFWSGQMHDHYGELFLYLAFRNIKKFQKRLNEQEKRIQKNKEVKKGKVGGFHTNPYISTRKLSLKTVLHCLEWETIFKIGLNPPTFEGYQLDEQNLELFEQEGKTLAIRQFFCGSKNGSYGYIYLEQPLPLEEVFSYHGPDEKEVVEIKTDIGIDLLTEYQYDDGDEVLEIYKHEYQNIDSFND